jgi:hypothetical protein
MFDISMYFRLRMSRATYIIGALAGSAVVAYVCDKVISDDKLFGGKF